MAIGINIRAAQRAGDHVTVTVGRNGTGDFPNIKDALDYVGRFANSQSNFAVVKLGAGTHTLNNSSAPVTLPAFCALIGDSEAVCNVVGTDDTKDLLIADSLYCANISFSNCAYAIRHSGGGTCYIRECEADATVNATGGLADCSSTGLTFIQRCAGAFTSGTFIRVTAGLAVAIEKCNNIFHSGTNVFDISAGTDVQLNDNTITNNSVTCFKFSGGAITSFNNLCKQIGTGYDISGASGSLFSKNDVVRVASVKDLVTANGTAFSYNFVNGVFNSNNFTIGTSTVRPYNFTDLYSVQAGNFNIRGKLAPFSTGSAPICGNAVLVAGTVTVTTSAATTNVLVLLTRKTAGGTTGELTYTITAGTSFTINSANAADTSTVSWMLVEPT